MFSRKKRELMKTPSISKKNRAGSPSPQPSGVSEPLRGGGAGGDLGATGARKAGAWRRHAGLAAGGSDQLQPPPGGAAGARQGCWGPWRSAHGRRPPCWPPPPQSYPGPAVGLRDQVGRAWVGVASGQGLHRMGAQGVWGLQCGWTSAPWPARHWAEGLECSQTSAGTSTGVPWLSASRAPGSA